MCMCSGVRECLFRSEEESVRAYLCVLFSLSVYVAEIGAASFPNLTSCVTMPSDLGSSLGPQRQHFHTDITYTTQALFQPLQTVFTAEV